MAWHEAAGLGTPARGATAGAVWLPFGLVAGEVGAACTFDSGRIDHLAQDGNGHRRIRRDPAVLVDHEVLDGGGLAFLQGPVLAAQSDESIPAAELRGTAVGYVFPALIADGTLDLKARAPYALIRQVESRLELAFVTCDRLGLMDRQDIGRSVLPGAVAWGRNTRELEAGGRRSRDFECSGKEARCNTRRRVGVGSACMQRGLRGRFDQVAGLIKR